MATGYIQEFNSQPGDKVDAELFTNEYGLINAAFNKTNGHTHSGEEGGGSFITTIADSGNLNSVQIDDATNSIKLTINDGDVQTPKLLLNTNSLVPAETNTVSLGSYTTRYKNLYVQGLTNTDQLQVGTTDPALEIPGELVTITDIHNDNELTQNSSTALATQSSIKSYVDTEIANSDGIFSQSEFMYRTSDQQLSGGYSAYLELGINNVQQGSNIHIHASVSVEATALSTDVGNALAMLHRDGVPFTEETYVVSTNVTLDAVNGTAGIVFRQDNVDAGDYVYGVYLKEELVNAIALSGSLLLLEEVK